MRGPDASQKCRGPADSCIEHKNLPLSYILILTFDYKAKYESVILVPILRGPLFGLVFECQLLPEVTSVGGIAAANSAVMVAAKMTST
jgi:hypothetical protein